MGEKQSSYFLLEKALAKRTVYGQTGLINLSEDFNLTWLFPSSVTNSLKRSKVKEVNETVNRWIKAKRNTSFLLY